MLTGSSLTGAVVTCCCSYLSLLGSLLIITSYLIARTRSTPKSAFLILHLATSDFFWFLSSATMSTLWLANDGSVPDEVCFLVSPIIELTRMTSLIWTVVISYNVLMSVRKRKWFWKSQQDDWEFYRKLYFGIIFLLASPGTIFKIVKQHAGTNDSLGCLPGYEPIGAWYEVFFTELLPMAIGFLFNLYVFCNVRHKMSKSAFPLSVRKRRKRVMYYYIIVCILCWIPTIMLYILEIAGYHSPTFDIIARTSLYISGFLNFLVFGRADPHLKRSFDVMLYYSGLATLCGVRYTQVLKSADVDKSVMFREETILGNADTSKDKMNVYRNRKLSREDKAALYKDRPDLDPRYKITRAPKRQVANGVSTGKPKSALKTSSKYGEEEAEAALKTPLLSASNTPSPSPARGDRDRDEDREDAESQESQDILYVDDEEFASQQNHSSGNQEDPDTGSSGHNLSLLSLVSNNENDNDDDEQETKKERQDSVTLLKKRKEKKAKDRANDTNNEKEDEESGSGRAGGYGEEEEDSSTANDDPGYDSDSSSEDEEDDEDKDFNNATY